MPETQSISTAPARAAAFAVDVPPWPGRLDQGAVLEVAFVAAEQFGARAWHWQVTRDTLEKLKGVVFNNGFPAVEQSDCWCCGAKRAAYLCNVLIRPTDHDVMPDDCIWAVELGTHVAKKPQQGALL